MMRFKISVLILSLVLLLSLPNFLRGDEGFPCFTPPVWKYLIEGLEISQVRALKYCEMGNENIVILRAKPDKIKFSTVHYTITSTGRPLPIEKWQQDLKAAVVFNAGQYDEKNRHLGLLVNHGRNLGTSLHPLWKGLFVSEPKVSGPPRANIIDLNFAGFELSSNPYQTVVQTMMLFDENGKKRVRQSDWLANRTCMAIDSNGMIYVFVTEGAYTLWNFAEMLQRNDLKLTKAISLDGGFATQMAIKTNNFFYSIYGQWTKDDSGNHSIPGVKMPLPAVIAMFPRPAL